MRASLQRAMPATDGGRLPDALERIEQGRLTNGVRWMLWPDRQAAMAQVSWASCGGAVLDPPAKEGLATVAGMAALRSVPLAELSSSGRLTVDSGWHTTCTGLQCLASKLDTALPIFIDRALAARCGEPALATAKRQALSTVQRNAWRVEHLVERALAGRLYDGHRYSRPRWGDMDSIRSIDQRDVETFLASHTLTRSSVLIASGPLAPEQLVRALERALDGSQEVGARAPLPAIGAPPTSRSVIVIDHPGADRAELRLGFPAPPLDSPDYAAFWTLATVLGGSPRSRLNRELRESLGWTYQVRCNVDARLGFGSLTIHASVAVQRLSEAVDTILHGVRRLHSELASDVEWRNAVRRQAGLFVQSLQTTDGQTRQLVRLVARGFPADNLGSFWAHLQRVDREDLRRLAADFLLPDRVTMVVTGPADVLRRELPDWPEERPEGFR